MGAYSSWASFAVSNHYIMYYCCRKLHKDWKQAPYVILGDDILIGNKELAELYISTIKSIGVEISGVKTHISNNFAEFAKRLLFEGQEISPFPVSAIRESQKKYFLMVSLLLEQGEREWCAIEGIPRAIEYFYTYVRPLRRKLRNEIVRKSEISELMVKTMRGVIPASCVINHIARQINPLSDPISEKSSKIILSKLIEKLFWESDPTSSGRSGSLGNLAYSYLITMTSEEEFYSILMPAGFDVSFIPLLQVYGQVEEKWLKLRKQGLDITDLGEDWPLILRSFTLPISDKIFTMKSKDLRSQASASLSIRIHAEVREYLHSKGEIPILL